MRTGLTRLDQSPQIYIVSPKNVCVRKVPLAGIVPTNMHTDLMRLDQSLQIYFVICIS